MANRSIFMKLPFFRRHARRTHHVSYEDLGMLAQAFRGEKKEKPPFICMSPIECGCVAIATRPLSLPAPRVITWVALGGLLS